MENLEFTVRLEPEDADAEELDDRTRELLRDLREQPVESAELVRAGSAADRRGRTLLRVVRGYASLSATDGSTLAARRAGIQLASSATASSNAPAAANAAGSVGSTP